MSNWHYAKDGQQLGPVTDEQVVAMVQQGQLQVTDLIWKEGMAEWQPVSAVAEFAGLASAGVSAQPQVSAQQQQHPSATFGAGARLGLMPKTYMVQSILATIFCCLPLGIVGIIFASQVSTKYAQGDTIGATKASNMAKLFTTISALLTLILLGIWAAIVLMGITTGSAAKRQQQELQKEQQEQMEQFYRQQR